MVCQFVSCSDWQKCSEKDGKINIEIALMIPESIIEYVGNVFSKTIIFFGKYF